MTDETCLYRAFDRKGALLYVGISLRVLSRLQQHRSTSEWFNDMAHLTVERHPTRSAAFTAERKAILSEAPKFNRTWNRPHSLQRYEESEGPPASPTRFDLKLPTIKPSPSGRLKKIKKPPPNVNEARAKISNAGFDPSYFTDEACLKMAGMNTA